MTLPNPKWQPAVSDTLDAGPAVDKGGGLVGLPITGHAFLVGQVVTIAGTDHYDGAYAIVSQTANEIVITATYTAETFAGTETVVFGPQPIVKQDFIDLEDAILGQSSVRMQPPMVWVDATTVRILATSDCKAEMALSGMPNILNSSVQVSGGLADGVVRSNSSNVSAIIGSGGIWGNEKNSQWYAVFGIAGDTDTTFTLKGMPIMRFKSQASQVISLGTLVTPASGIGYGFTTDELVGGIVYFLSGASKGLMRAITANNNDNSTGGTITYGGAALTLSAGDWFIVLPPTNFRLVGTFFNNSAGNIEQFVREGNKVYRVTDYSANTASNGVLEDIALACPLATEVFGTFYTDDGSIVYVGHPDTTYNTGATYQLGSGRHYLQIGVKNCRIYFNQNGSHIYYYPNGYSYPPGCGY
jgi:hypothetical protein